MTETILKQDLAINATPNISTKRPTYKEILDAEYADTILTSICADCERTNALNACLGIGDKCALNVLAKLMTAGRD